MTQSEVLLSKALSELEDIKDRNRKIRHKDCTVVNDSKTSKIILPENMSPDEGIIWLNKHIQHLNEEIQPNIPISCYPYDGLVAFNRAIKHVFGFVSVESTPGFWGDEPPKMMTIQTSKNTTEQVPIGRMRMQGIDGYIEVIPGMYSGKPSLIISGKIKRKSIENLNKLTERTKIELKNGSIYKGKAIILGRRSDEQTTKEKYFESMPGGMSCSPEFMSITQNSSSSIILNRVTEKQIEDFLWTPIQKSEACRRSGIPLKRGILLSGHFGTGKSLTASITAKIAVENNWTFINLVNSKMLAIAIDIASWYQPAVIFTEDVDTIMSGDRDENMNNILNVVDGVDKEREIFVVLTTNYLEKISKAFLRPGRLDAIIEFNFPDQEATERLIRHYAKDLVDINEDISEPASIIAGSPPAMIRECVERAKLSAISRSGNATTIISSDLIVSAEGLKTHLKMMRDEPDNKNESTRKFGKLMIEGSALMGKLLTSVT